MSPKMVELRKAGPDRELQVYGRNSIPIVHQMQRISVVLCCCLVILCYLDGASMTGMKVVFLAFDGQKKTYK